MKKEAGKDTPLFGGVLIGHCRPVSVSTNAILLAINNHPRICEIALAKPVTLVPDAIRVAMLFHSLDSTVVDILRPQVKLFSCHRPLFNPDQLGVSLCWDWYLFPLA